MSCCVLHPGYFSIIIIIITLLRTSSFIRSFVPSHKTPESKGRRWNFHAIVTFNAFHLWRFQITSTDCCLSVYLGESPYKCTQCSRAFVRSTDLQRHLRNHTGEKPYKCQECSRAFARSTDLKRHMRTHTGEKPYKCWQCSKAFSQSGSLQTHLHTHYKESLQMKVVIPDKSKRT